MEPIGEAEFEWQQAFRGALFSRVYDYFLIFVMRFFEGRVPRRDKVRSSARKCGLLKAGNPTYFCQ
jgi:hypothetical protein